MVILVVSAVSDATAQQKVMESAGVQLADSIAQAKQKTVAVLDFSGPGDKVTALGEKLANDLSDSMAKSGANIQIEDRTRIERERQSDTHPVDIVLDPGLAVLFTQDLGTKALVMGALSLGPNNRLNVTLNAYKADDGKGIKALKVWFPLTDEMADLMSERIATFTLPDNLASFPKSDAPGYAAPVCIHCPSAAYTLQASARRVNGVVVLVAIVGTDGRLKDITVLKSLREGLTEQAIKTVEKWELKPAIGPDGKPAAVREAIRVSFDAF
jgi:TonB family protein